VYVIKNNQPRYVVMREEDYAGLMSELSETRLAASEADLAAGRVRRGTAGELMRELTREGR
jgi:PHD/YefM family antitoxin component YafN of YafNO toxin-antitoxin module